MSSWALPCLRLEGLRFFSSSFSSLLLVLLFLSFLSLPAVLAVSSLRWLLFPASFFFLFVLAPLRPSLLSRRRLFTPALAGQQRRQDLMLLCLYWLLEGACLLFADPFKCPVGAGPNAVCACPLLRLSGLFWA